jgi:hypothetical protein
MEMQKYSYSLQGMREKGKCIRSHVNFRFTRAYPVLTLTLGYSSKVHACTRMHVDITCIVCFPVTVTAFIHVCICLKIGDYVYLQSNYTYESIC